MLLSNKKIIQIFSLVLFPTFLYSISTNISGIVFQDLPVQNKGGTLTLNIYGLKDNNELGVQNIKVTAYPDNISAITDSNGTWTLAVTQDSRIEFSNIPSYLQVSPSGSTNNSSIQFVKQGNIALTFALHNPSDFSDSINPTYVVNLQENGTHRGSNLPSLHFLNYIASGLNNSYHDFRGQQGTGPRPNDTITSDIIGSVWGKAYQKNKKRLFVASMLQRHVGYSPNPDSNSASIYIVDYSNNTTNDNKVSHFSLQGKSPANGGNKIDLGTILRADLRDNPLKPNVDKDAYANVGKMSYGGIDIDHNSNTLWLLNLNQRSIISHDISLNNPENGTTKQYQLMHRQNIPTCNNTGELRPWALKIHQNRGYIGAICDASISKLSNDLSAHIFSFDINNPSNGFRNELDFTLNYPRQLEGWHIWEDTFVNTAKRTKDLNVYDQPILSDIEFDEHNNMYIAFIDRYATQLGKGNYAIRNHKTEKAYSYGEILKVCNNQGIYNLEGSNNCKKFNYSDNNITEFFNDTGGSGTRESALGSLAILKGSQEILATSLNPHPENILNNKQFWNTQGVQTFSTSTDNNGGAIQNWYSNAMTEGKGLNGKANGLGDIELITAAAPIEIGNRIWNDTDTNGIQDAQEKGIEGVSIQLKCNGNIVATAISNSNGNYIFSNDPKPRNILNQNKKSHIYNIKELKEKNSENCTIIIPNIKGNSQQVTLKGYTLTSKKNKYLINSDAIINDNNATITILPIDIKFSGANNHSLDIGFTKPSVVIPPNPNPNPNPTPNPTVTPTPTPNSGYSLGNYVWLDDNRDGIQDINESGVDNVLVTLYNTADCSGEKNATTRTNENGLYEFLNLNNGTYCVAFSNLPNEHNITLSNASNDNLDSDTNNNAIISNIIIFNDDNLTNDMGIYSNATIVAGTIDHNNGECSCHPYTEKSISLFNNLFSILFLLSSIFIIALSSLKKDTLSI